VSTLYKVLQTVYQVLRELGYRPIVVGTYALILQGWLPPSYIAETKDIDVYVDDPAIVFDERFERRMVGLGLSLGRSEAGGIYIDAEKPVEILYPIHDIFIPRELLRHTITINDMEVLEGHAVIVAKSLGGDVSHLARIIKSMGVEVEIEKIRRLTEEIQPELEPAMRHIVARRIAKFIEEFRPQESTEVVTV